MRSRNAKHGRGRTIATALTAAACAGALAHGLAAPAAAAPPDGRAYEMVSPVEKGGFDITAWTQGGWAKGAVDGERVNYGLYGNIEGGTTSFLGTAMLQSKRTPAGWTSAGMLPDLRPGAPYHVGFGQGQVLGETPDLETTVVSSTQPETAGTTAGFWNIFARDRDGRFALTAPGLAPYADNPGSFPIPGVSDDGRHVLFESSVQLTPNAAAGFANLYESVDGVVRLAGILPNGTTPVRGSAGAGRQYHHAISADGSRVFFLDRDSGQLYVRIDGQETIHVSKPYYNRDDDRGTAGTASYAWATPDGSKVAFISAGRLTPNAPSGGDVYLFDVATQRLTNLTATAGRASAVTSIVGISDDGGTVYFHSATLSTLPAPEGGTARGFYVWHDGTLRLVAGTRSGQQERLDRLTSYVAPGGRMVFHTTAQVGPYPMSGADVNVSNFRVFLYDPEGAGRLTCLSCLPDGRAENVDSWAGTFNEGVAKLFTYRRMHAISDDGRRVWFETPAALVPEDQNGRQDVYQWEEGAGLSLISSGRSTADSFLGDASADGDDVFFFTREQLTADDVDTLLDVYDARVGGGLPSRIPPERDRTCPAAGCQGDPAPRPQDREAGSVTDPSDGNVADPIAPADPVPFELTLLTASATRTTVAVRLHVNRAGKVATRLQVRRGSRWVVAGSTTRTLRRAGSTTVRVALSKQARKQLTRTRRLTVRVEVRAGGQLRRQQLTVKAPRRAKGKANG